jgi:hypothetical protein
MFKEFPYYDRCKPIFTNALIMDSPSDAAAACSVVQPPQSSSIIAPVTATEEELLDDGMKTEFIHVNEPSSPNLDNNIPSENKRLDNNQLSPFAVIKKRKVNTFNKPTSNG